MPLSPVLNLAPYPKMDREATASPPAAATLRACIGCYLLVMPRSVQALHPPSGGPHPPTDTAPHALSTHTNQPAKPKRSFLHRHTPRRCLCLAAHGTARGHPAWGRRGPERRSPSKASLGGMHVAAAKRLPCPSHPFPFPSLSPPPSGTPPEAQHPAATQPHPTPGTPRRVRGTPGFHPPGALREKPGPPPPRPPIPPRPAPGLTAEPGVLLPGADLADLQRPPAERGEHQALPQEVAARVAEAVRGGGG